jgi:xylulokinase
MRRSIARPLPAAPRAALWWRSRQRRAASAAAMTASFIGLDIGTSSVKALLMDEAQRTIASASAPLSVSRPHPGWSEQNPDDWTEAADAAMLDLKRGHAAAMAQVRGIGLSGQMHGATLLGRDHRPLRPCILWNDGRSAVEARALDDAVTHRITGNLAMPGFTAPKLAWVMAHEPEVFAATRMVLLPKDFVRLWLTGELVSEPSDAAGTLWLDTGKRQWSDEMLARTGLDRSHMPRLVEGTQASGAVRPDLAARWGLPAGVVVAGGGGDNAASAAGVGAVRPGTGFVSLGTSGVIFLSADRHRPNPGRAVHAFCHAVPGTWHQMGVTLSAASALDWLAGALGRPVAGLFEGLPAAVDAPPAEQFLPYLSGERTPHNDVAIRAAFAGLSHETTPASLARAAMAGVAFALRDGLEALTVPLADPPALLAVGGGSRSPYWLSMISTVLGVPLHLPADGDFGAAFGAARLGLIASTGADPATVCATPAIARAVEPDARRRAAWDDAYARWRRLYPALKEATR